jgi:hypothetical protein
MYPDIPDHWAEGAHKEGDHFGPPPPPRPINIDDAGDSDQWEMYQEGGVD